MKTRSKEVNIFSMSALDLFASALGAFILITVILLPYFPNTGDSPERITEVKKELDKVKKQLEAAERITEVKKELDKVKKQLEAAKKTKFPDLDLVIALDTTGSMGKAIGGLKSEVGSMVKVLSKLTPSLNVGVISFKDRLNSPTTTSFPLQRIETSGKSIDGLRRYLDSLEAGGTGQNPDVPEALYSALQLGVKMNWRKSSKVKMIVVVTDAPPYSYEISSSLSLARSFVSQGAGRRISGVFSNSTGNPRLEAAEFLERLSKEGKGNYVESSASITADILLALLDS